jgi:HEAT repeat protein
MLPFLYRCLTDKDKSVRTSAIQSIQNFGPQGELMFIEGLTKEPNEMIRAECARGLGRIGPTTFRTLLLGLHDRSYSVRDACSKSIVKHMTPESVVEVFQEREYQRQSLICSTQDVINSQYEIDKQISSEMVVFLHQLLDLLVQTDGNPLAAENH